MLGALGALAAMTACVGGDPVAAPTPEPVFSPDPAPEPPGELLYVQGSTLKVYDLEAGASKTITELPRADVAVSPDGKLLVAVQETATEAEHGSEEGDGDEGEGEGPAEDPEGFTAPELVVASTSGPEVPSVLGPGRSPVWAANSAAVAAIAPQEGAEAIVVYELPGQAVTTGATGDHWAMVGWQGQEVVAIGARTGVIAAAPGTERVSKLRVAPSSLWGVSPAGDGVLTAGAGEIHLGAARSITVDIDGAFADGSWSWEGSHIAAVVLRDGGRGHLVLIRASNGKIEEVKAGLGAQGNVVWSHDGTTFAFVRVHPKAPRQLQAVVCTIELECEPTFSWGQGVQLLAFR